MTAQIDALIRARERIDSCLVETAGAVAELKLSVAVLNQQVVELRSWKDETKKQTEEWARKWWMIVPPVIAAILSSALTGLITYLLKK